MPHSPGLRREPRGTGGSFQSVAATWAQAVCSSKPPRDLRSQGSCTQLCWRLSAVTGDAVCFLHASFSLRQVSLSSLLNTHDKRRFEECDD